MGDTPDVKSTLSWVGKVADSPKPFGKTTKGGAALTEQDLAEFEQAMLKLVQEMATKIPKEKGGD